MQADAMTAMAVKAVLDTVAEAYATRNLTTLRRIFATDPDVIMYGTGADEKRVGLAEIQLQAQRDWSQSDSSEVRFGWMSISSAGDVAWAATDAEFVIGAGGQTFALPARITFVLERRSGVWLIVQSHFSFAAASQEEGESFPV